MLKEDRHSGPLRLMVLSIVQVCPIIGFRVCVGHRPGPPGRSPVGRGEPN